MTQHSKHNRHLAMVGSIGGKAPPLTGTHAQAPAHRRLGAPAHRRLGLRPTEAQTHHHRGCNRVTPAILRPYRLSCQWERLAPGLGACYETRGTARLLGRSTPQQFLALTNRQCQSVDQHLALDGIV